MKIKNWNNAFRNQDKIISQFGHARLIKRGDGKHELIGGSTEDRIAAREWVSLFLHEAVVRELPGHRS